VKLNTYHSQLFFSSSHIDKRTLFTGINAGTGNQFFPYREYYKSPGTTIHGGSISECSHRSVKVGLLTGQTYSGQVHVG